jgi:SAM-dependent methyltransferase
MTDPVGANLYDEIVYPSSPMPQTHPDRLAVLASFYGLQPALVERCRILELGCGDGSNLIPMALGLPAAELLGVDLAAGPIARGQETARALGLRNITLRCENVLDVARPTAPMGPFDYIIAHGLYSWVSADARRAILQIFRRLLAPHGVAFLSYNAYPGSHLRDMVREMLLYHAAGSNDSQLTIARAQGLARVLADAMPAADELVSIRASLRSAAARDPAALFHDELAPEYQAFYFHEVVQHAAEHDLQYLAEADFLEMQDHAFPPKVREILQTIEQERGRVAREQYLDFIKGRRFRQTLLCRADVALDRTPSSEDVRRFLIASPMRCASDEPDLQPGVIQAFDGPVRARVQIDLPLAKAALLELGEAWPARLSFDELADRASRRLVDHGLAVTDGEDARHTLADVLFDSFGAGILQLYAWMPRLTLQPGERPTVSPLARLQAMRDAPSGISTLLHTTVAVDDPLARQTLQLLDGTRDRAALLTDLQVWARDHHQPDAPATGAATAELNPSTAEASLQGLARLGLLVS